MGVFRVIAFGLGLKEEEVEKVILTGPFDLVGSLGITLVAYREISGLTAVESLWLQDAGEAFKDRDI